MIIDPRCRYMTRESIGYFQAAGKKGLQAHGTPEDFIKQLDECGVQTALSPTASNLGLKIGDINLAPRIPDHEMQAELQKKFPERFVGTAGIDPSDDKGLELLEHCVHELDLRVAAIEPGREPMLAPNPADRRLYQFYSLAQELEVPVFIQTSGFKGGTNIDYANPKWIDQVAHDFPNLNILCAHGCFPFFREMGVVVMRRPNVYALPDCYTFFDFPRIKEIARLKQKQLVFASSYPVNPLPQSIDNYLKANWSHAGKDTTDLLNNIMYKNAIRALRLAERSTFFSSLLGE